MPDLEEFRIVQATDVADEEQREGGSVLDRCVLIRGHADAHAPALVWHFSRALQQTLGHFSLRLQFLIEGGQEFIRDLGHGG